MTMLDEDPALATDGKIDGMMAAVPTEVIVRTKSRLPLFWWAYNAVGGVACMWAPSGETKHDTNGMLAVAATTATSRRGVNGIMVNRRYVKAGRA